MGRFVKDGDRNQHIGALDAEGRNRRFRQTSRRRGGFTD
jgi:hypothetical protein